LHLLARRRSNAAIAMELGLSGKTNANNVSNIFSKKQVADLAEAIIRAREAGPSDIRCGAEPQTTEDSDQLTPKMTIPVVP
jgi:hypothetical protein